MKFQDLSEKQILELFESAPIEDLNLLHKFYKVYKLIILSLCEAYSGYAYQKDLYEVYKAFYAPQKLSYGAFSRILKEMEEANFIGAKNGNPKVVFMKQKAYELIGKNQTTIHSSRINNRSMKKAKMLTQIHLKLVKVFSNYRPTWLKRSEINSSIYSIISSNVEYHFLLCLKEKQKSEDLKAEALQFLGKNNELGEKERVYFHLVTDEETKRYNSALAKLKNASNLQYYLSNNQLVIQNLVFEI